MASWYQVEGRETGWWESGCCPLGAGLSRPPSDSHWSQLPLSPLADRPLLDPSPDPRWRVTCDPGPQHTRDARGPCTPISRPGWSAVGKPITSFGSLARLSRVPDSIEQNTGDNPTFPSSPCKQAHRHTSRHQEDRGRTRATGVPRPAGGPAGINRDSHVRLANGAGTEEADGGYIFSRDRKNVPVAIKQLHLLSRWTCTYRHQHPARIICTLPWRPSVLPVYLSALHLQIPLGSVSPERGKRVPRRRPRDTSRLTPLIAETSQHSRASSARDSPSGSGPRPCGRKSLRFGGP